MTKPTTNFINLAANNSALPVGRFSRWKQTLKGLIGPSRSVTLRCLVYRYPRPSWGNLRRTTPFSRVWGFDRGTPVSRYYLDHFFEKHQSFITGDLLEIQAPIYTRRFGHALGRCDSVDIDPRFSPTYLCDLAASSEVIPDNSYDCFLMPNTLNVLRNICGCLLNALRIVKPGGVILASSAGFLPLQPGGGDYWHLSADGWKSLIDPLWPGCDVEVNANGNCLAVIAAMLGLAREELTPLELQVDDPAYPVLITIFCRKPRSSSVPNKCNAA